MKLKRVAAVLSALCMMLTTANGGVIDAFITAKAEDSVESTEKTCDAPTEETQKVTTEDPTGEKDVEMPGLTLNNFSTGINIRSTEISTFDSFTYTVSDEQVTITEVNTSASGEIVIPETIEDYPVVAIGSSAFCGCKRITSIVLPDSVTSIESYAFQDCVSLSSITLGKVEYMGYNVFLAVLL